MVVLSPVTASAFDNLATYSGQGIENGVLEEQDCDGSGPYLLWVLTATGANNAEITGPWGTATMTQGGKGTGAFKFRSNYYAPALLIDQVTATYDGAPTNAQLVISHGCPGQQNS
jgi:hypothetical protein